MGWEGRGGGKEGEGERGKGGVCRGRSTNLGLSASPALVRTSRYSDHTPDMAGTSVLLHTHTHVSFTSTSKLQTTVFALWVVVIGCWALPG